MYTKYFGFNEKPFTLTPNPRFIFLSKHHKEAFAHLLYGINNHYGFIELTGEVGTGKTTVLRTLLGQLQDDSYRTALIFSSCQTGVELLRSINSEFGLDSSREYANELLAELNRFLLTETAAGRTVVLVIDEAQVLQPDVLEQVRLISNLETENDKLIQIILSGQPELETLLQRPDLRQLNQRIAVRYKLCALSLDEARAYIKQRMEVAGETGGVSFTRSAVLVIFLFTRGVPRMLNILCDRALLVAYGDERRRVTVSIVLRAMWELLNRSQGRLVTSIIAVSITVAILAFMAIVIMKWPQAGELLQRFRPSPVQAPVTSHIQFVPHPPLPDNISTTTLQMLEREITSYDQNDTHVLAFNALAEQWGVRPITVVNEAFDIPDMFRRVAARRKLRVTLFKGSLDQVIRFNLPFVAVTMPTGELGEYCYAVTSLDNGYITISPSLFGRSSIQKSDLEIVSNGTYYLVWRNFSQIPDTILPGEKRIEVRSLQKLLKSAGYFNEQIDGNYNHSTVQAVRDFQHSLGIADNESLGELTLAALNRFDSGHMTPSLKGN